MICKFILDVTLLPTIMVSHALKLASCCVTLGTLLNLSEPIISFEEMIIIIYTAQSCF